MTTPVQAEVIAELDAEVGVVRSRLLSLPESTDRAAALHSLEEVSVSGHLAVLDTIDQPLPDVDAPSADPEPEVEEPLAVANTEPEPQTDVVHRKAPAKRSRKAAKKA